MPVVQYGGALLIPFESRLASSLAPKGMMILGHTTPALDVPTGAGYTRATYQIDLGLYLARGTIGGL